jgi:hypothetical protein
MLYPRKSISPYKRIVKSLSTASAVVLGALLVATALPTVAAAQMVMDVDHEMEATSANPQNYTLVSCGKSGKEESLPAGDYSSDLHVDGRCVADGTQGKGIYKYHWVFIHKNGKLTFNDAKLDLYASSILVLNGGTLTAGAPDENGAIGAKGGRVTIHLWGAKDSAAIFCQDENGKEDKMCGVPSGIWNGPNKTDKIYPPDKCDPNSEYPPGDCFYQYDQGVPNPLYFGRKTLAVSYGGTLQLFGKKGSTFDGLNPSPQDTGKS